MVKRKVLLILFSAILLIGCEKAVTFHLDQQSPIIVVEATIENGQPPVVFLSHSLNYFSEINAAILDSSFIHNASVYISNGNLIQQLKEYRQSLDSGYSAYYYSIDSANLSTAFLGQLKKQYSLRIIANHQEYTATTTIPDIRTKVDSLWWKPAPSGVDNKEAIVMVRETDQPGYGDYARYFTSRNNQPFYPGINSVFNDLVIDGTTYNVQVEPGVDRNTKRSDSDHYFNKGDTVTFKLSNIDKATYDFWRTMEYSYQSIGNPFATPIKVLGNISNGALGYFGGYASQYRTVIIPK